MREFFIKTLKELRAMTGSRQMEFLSPEETKMILDKLCRVSEQFAYIPEAKQMAEVDKQIIEDLEFTGLTPKIFYKWMFKICEPYWKSRLTEEDLTPHEVAKPEVADKYLKEWEEALGKMQMKYTEEGTNSGTRLKASIDELAPKPTTQYKSAVNDEAHELHLQWIKANFFADGKPRPGFMEEIIWTKQQAK